MLLIKPHKNYVYKKKDIQLAGEIILRNKPAQNSIFNIIAMVCTKDNGVGSRSYEAIAKQYTEQTGRSMSIQRVGTIVKQLESDGLVAKASEDIGPKRKSICTFRIAHLDVLLVMVEKVRTMVAKTTEMIESAVEIVEEQVERAREFVESAKSKAKNFIVNKKKRIRTEQVPDWFEEEKKKQAEKKKKQEDDDDFDVEAARRALEKELKNFKKE